MSKPTNAVRERWNAKTYDDLRIRVPKGRRADIDARVRSEGKSVNGIVNQFLRDYLGFTEEEWKKKPEEQD